MNKIVKRTIAVVTVAALVLSFTACTGTNQDTVPVAAVTAGITVETVTPHVGDIVVVGEYIGTVEPSRRVTVIPRIPGEVQSVHFGVGDTVAAGDVLFTIDAVDIVNNISSLEAQLAVQDATVRAAQTGVYLVDGSALQSQILSADGGVTQANFAISQAEQGVEQTLIGIEQAQIAMEQAQIGINQALLGIEHAQIGVEQALIGVEQAQTAYDFAAASFSNTTILFEADIVARTAFEQAEMAYLNAYAALERAVGGHTSALLGLSQAQQAHSQAENGFSQTQQAHSQAQQAYLQAQRGLAQARQAHNQALAGQRIVAEDAPAEGRRRAQDALEQAKAARNATYLGIQIARERLDDALVRAPIGGVIETRNVEPFDMASPGVPAFVISQDGINATFRVPSSSAAQLKLGDTITLNVGGYGYYGVITEISTAVNISGMITVRASIPNPPDNLPGGSSVRIFADAERAENILVVPLSAVHFERGVPFVFIAEDGIARRVQVETGLFDENYMQIIAGVEPHSQIINTWSARLADGARIEVRLGT